MGKIYKTSNSQNKFNGKWICENIFNFIMKQWDINFLPFRLSKIKINNDTNCWGRDEPKYRS